VLRAALSALERGYRVQVPVDARGGLSARTENVALRHIEAAGGAPILARCARLLGLPMLHSVVPQGGKAPWRSRAHDGGRHDARDDQVCGVSEDPGGTAEATFLRTAFLTTALRTAFSTTALALSKFALLHVVLMSASSI
jgi:hypothetical protein